MSFFDGTSDRPRQSQNLTHWSVLAGRESLTTSRALNRFHGQKNRPWRRCRLVSCGMDRTKLQRQLELAATHIARGEEHIARQHQLIWELERDKQDTTEAWCLLTELEAAQALHIVDRDRLINKLADRA